MLLERPRLVLVMGLLSLCSAGCVATWMPPEGGGDAGGDSEPLQFLSTGDMTSSATTDESSTGMQAVTMDMTDGADSDGTSSGGGGSSSDSDGQTDFPTNETDGQYDPIVGCSKVDFLFVVDSHSGGGGALNALKNSLEGFVSNVEGLLPDHDLHFMVVDTDDRWGSAACEQACLLEDSCESADWPEYACDMQLENCDEEWGAGIVYPSGSDVACNVEPGARYMTGDNLATLEDDLWCLLNVGSHGDGQQKQARALYSSLLPFNTNPGQCNAGFLRDDALLVITLVTSLPDFASDNEPPDWYEMIIAAKDDKPESIVFLGLLDDSHKANNICDQPFMDPEQRLSTLVNSFEFGIEGSVCSTTYDQYFDQAFGFIGDACDLIVPG